MIKKRIPRLFACAAALACVFGFLMLTPATPTASADNLPNGLTVTCSAVGDNQLTCVIGGCPRVNGNYVVDAVHVMDNGYQTEYKDWSCINGATVTHSIPIIISGIGPGGYTLGFQGCRKKDFEDDWCTAYNNYTYHPPAPATTTCPAGSKTPTVTPPAQCEAVAKVKCPEGSPTTDAVSLDQCAPAPPKTCPDGSVTPEVPAGQQCQPPSKAITMNITKGGSNADIKITNSSGLPVDCAYVANKTSGGFTPGDDQVTLNISVGPHSTATNSDLLFPILGAKYNASVKCTGTWNGQPVVVGEASQNVP